MKINRKILLALAACLAILVLLAGAAPAILGQRLFTAKPGVQLAAQAPVSSPVPVFAYYYIWYDTSSWNRAKIDYPLLGRYSSDDIDVMRQHIRWAKSAGITGFIVSWKSTPVLNRRLEQLATVAAQENFKLAIIYQGLDFSRNPLSVDQVASDLDYFIQHFAALPVFHIYSEPLVIWSGTWKFTTQQVSQVAQGRSSALLLLASERDVAGYLRLADLVAGDAYYWSSVNPDTFPGYQNKLDQMSQAIHQNGGMWIAPAAPGFDARLIGGTTLVDRKNGATFRVEINAAQASSPDAIGIISWNEFSENSHIEPSQTYGTQYLDILSQVDHLSAPNIVEFDSSIPDGVFAEVIPYSRPVALGGLAMLILVGLVVIARRRI
jgi:hypothetical protein